MKFAELIPLTAGLVNLLLTIFVLSQGLRSNTVRVYFLWGLSLTLWNLGTFFMFHVQTHEEALFWARLMQFGVIYLPISLAHLCYVVGHIPINRSIYLGYALHTALAVSNFTSFFIEDVRHVGYAFYCVAGPGFWVLVSTYSIPALAVYHLSQKVSTLAPLHRRRVVNMIIAVVTLIVFGFNDSLPILGVDRYPVLRTKIFPFGSAAAIFYGIIVGYSVLQHHLLDIHVSLSRIAARLVRFLFMFLTGLSLLLVLTVAAPGQFTTFTFLGSLGVLIVSAVVAAVFFPRLFGSGDEALERRILGDKFEYHDEIQGYIRSIPWYSDSNQLMNDFHELLVESVQAASYQIILQDEMTRRFKMFRSHPNGSDSGAVELTRESPVFEWFRSASSDYLAFNPAYKPSEATMLEEAAQRQLAPFNSEFCFPFMSDKEPFGLLLIGPKTSRAPYTPHDLHLLALLVKNLSLVINQMRLQHQVLLAEEMELLGRMSRGMAHDLNNLLTPISTLLQLTHAGPVSRENQAELLPVALRNVETMQSYIRAALFFSQNNKPHFQLARLDQLLHRVVHLADARVKQKNIEVRIDSPDGVVVEMDEALIQRLVGNLLTNAIDASPTGSPIRFELERQPPLDAGREWVRLHVVDAGEGISPENMRRISYAYFTTKDAGDENRGFGLGLAICRKIVRLHGGHLNLASAEKTGTTVQVDLPCRQNERPASVNGIKV